MSELHLLRLPINLRLFTEWALEKRYLTPPPGDGSGKPRDADPGYALHTLLTGLFGAQAPRPFCPSPLGQSEIRVGVGQTELWGYTSMPLGHLHALAHCAEDDQFATMIDWNQARTKPMPDIWPEGLCLRFDLRACPVRRRWADRPIITNTDDGNRRRSVVFDNPRGREMDAFQLATARAIEQQESPPTRRDAYIDWLVQWLNAKKDKPQAAALVEEQGPSPKDRRQYQVRIVSYHSTRLLRRPVELGRRQAKWLTRPDVHFSGVLRVTDGEAFQNILGTGVGRHCGFGFGMLMLKPA